MANRILISGIAGRMGQMIYTGLAGTKTFQCSAGYDIQHPRYDVSVPVSSNIKHIIDQCDFVVDFSLPDATMKIMPDCVRYKKGIVIGTTGFSDSQLTRLKKNSKHIPIFLAYNMSVGINILRHIVKKVADALPGTYEVEIVEQHHKDKQDAPSGTAYILGQEVAKSRKKNFKSVAKFGREGIAPRNKGDITFHSIRGGPIVGEHSVHFIGDHDRIILTHTAFDRLIFVEGVIQALTFIRKKTSGWYTMDQLTGLY